MDCNEVQNFAISLHLQWYHQRNESKTGLAKIVINVGDSASEKFNHIMYSFVTNQNKMYKSWKRKSQTTSLVIEVASFNFQDVPLLHQKKTKTN